MSCLFVPYFCIQGGNYTVNGACFLHLYQKVITMTAKFGAASVLGRERFLEYRLFSLTKKMHQQWHREGTSQDQALTAVRCCRFTTNSYEIIISPAVFSMQGFCKQVHTPEENTVDELHRLHIPLHAHATRKLLTKLALPMDLLLTVGPLVNVDMDGSRVPPNAISTSFGGCLKLSKKRGKSFRRDPVFYSPWVDDSSVCLKCQEKVSPHLINENQYVDVLSLLLAFFGQISPRLKFPLRSASRVIQDSGACCRRRARQTHRMDLKTHKKITYKRENREGGVRGNPSRLLPCSDRQSVLRKPRERYP